MRHNVVLLIGLLSNIVAITASAPQPSQLDKYLPQEKNHIIKSRSYSCVRPEVACPIEIKIGRNDRQRFIAHDINENSNSFILTLLEKIKEANERKATMTNEDNKKVLTSNEPDDSLEISRLSKDEDIDMRDDAVDSDIAIQFDMDL